MTIDNHIRESIYRLGYILTSITLTSIILFIYLPQLFKFSPFFFLHTSWDDAFISLLSIAILFSLLWTAPLISFHFYSWFTPGLLPKEYFYLKYIILWINSLISLYIIYGPTLIWSLPSFLLTFHSSSFLFTPSLSFLADLVWDFTFSFFIISLCTPISIYFRITRRTLYLILVLYSVVFQDIWSMVLMFIPLVLSYEITYFLFIWASIYLSGKTNS